MQMLQQKQITYQQAGQFEDTRFEKIHNVIYNSSEEASLLVAQEIANLIKGEAVCRKKMCSWFGHRLFSYKGI